MNEKERSSLSNNSHPKIIDSEDKIILEKQPPNDKILYFNLIKNNEDNNSINQGDSI